MPRSKEIITVISKLIEAVLGEVLESQIEVAVACKNDRARFKK